MYKAILGSYDSYHMDITAGSYDDAKEAYKAASQKYEELEDFEKKFYCPMVLVIDQNR